MNSSFVVENTLRLRYQDQPVSAVAPFGHRLPRESGKGKGNVFPRTGHEDPDEEKRYSCTLSLPSALDGVGGQLHVSAALPPKKIPGTNCTGGWVGPRASLDGSGECLRWVSICGPHSP